MDCKTLPPKRYSICQRLGSICDNKAIESSPDSDATVFPTSDKFFEPTAIRELDKEHFCAYYVHIMWTYMSVNE